MRDWRQPLFPLPAVRIVQTVSDGFGQPMAKEDLRLGMWLEVQGAVDESGTQGVAQTIRVRPAARGVVSAKGAGGLSLTVFEQHPTWQALLWVLRILRCHGLNNKDREK